MAIESALHPVLALLAAPLLLGVINKTKAFFAGRRGAPLLQLYFDLARLLGKGAVYSRTTTWVFRAGPAIGLAVAVVAIFLLPLGSVDALFRFDGDFVFLVYILGLGRLFTVLAALDTGSSFEGMGASREVQLSALAEPALLLVLAGLAHQADSLSLSGMFPALAQGQGGPASLLAAGALIIVLLAECSRIPVDDPNTHLELTMIHEVMVLDHSGPDFAFILYGAALKLWILGALVVGTVMPVATGLGLTDLTLGFAGMVALSVATGVVESSMARLRLVRLPQFIAAGTVLAILGLVLTLVRS
jgi:formate hydrogenlyase subunit 4